jgi:hypothetical protein
MSIPPGTRLGPHEIVAPLGAGGMSDAPRWLPFVSRMRFRA